jgi:5-methyltetrahydrofolate--homocysteine methyltransferase
MMNSFRSSLALLEKDENFASYISACAGDSASAPAAKRETEFSLREAVERGMKEAAALAAKKELAEKEPLQVINAGIIPALDTVGKGFENKTIYLPQLLMAAEAAKAAFEEVRQAMAGTSREVKGRMILATVKGDIHDIGKNIVKVMLENYGYEVIDLGRNVDPVVIADTVLKENIRLVGLSALMTTTVRAMEETIVLLRKVSPETKIVVGGAVLTKEYADKIGADRYAKDAMETVRYADEVFEVKA